MEGKRRGRLGVCSQSLHANVDWLKDWVDHQFQIGADEIILHAPQVPSDLSPVKAAYSQIQSSMTLHHDKHLTNPPASNATQGWLAFSVYLGRSTK